jgi:hypothetical protein
VIVKADGTYLSFSFKGLNNLGNNQEKVPIHDVLLFDFYSRMYTTAEGRVLNLRLKVSLKSQHRRRNFFLIL